MNGKHYFRGGWINLSTDGGQVWRNEKQEFLHRCQNIDYVSYELRVGAFCGLHLYARVKIKLKLFSIYYLKRKAKLLLHSLT
jgi:hypothetical protein